MSSLIQRLRQHWLASSLVVLAILVIALMGTVFTYGIFHSHWDGRVARGFARVFQVPAAKVGTQKITYTAYLFQLDADRRFLASPTARLQGLPTEVTDTIRMQALDRMMRAAAVEDMANEKKIVVTPLDVDRAYDTLVATASSSSVSEIRSALQDQFGWTEDDFQHLVVRPALMEDLLRQKMLQETGDAEAVDKAIIERLSRADVKRYLVFKVE